MRIFARKTSLSYCIGVALCVVSQLAWASSDDPTALPPLSSQTLTAESDNVSTSNDSDTQTDVSGIDEIWELTWAGSRLGRIIQIRKTNDGHIWIKQSDIEDQLATLSIDGLVVRGQWVRVSSIPGFQARWNAAEQILDIQIDPNLRPTQDLGTTGTVLPVVRLPVSWGSTLTYDVRASEAAGQRDYGTSVLTDIFGPYGILHTGFIWTNDRQELAPTYWEYNWQEHNMTLEIGDTVTSAPNWASNYLMRGVRWRRNFALSPDRVILSLPQISETAEIPGTLDVLLDNRVQYQGPINDGPFTISPGLGVNGSGNVQVVIQDALGRDRIIEKSIYVTPDLLAEDLFDFSLQGGELRDGQFNPNFVSGSVRYGARPDLTSEGYVEVSEDLWQVGVGGYWSPAQQYGVFSGSLQWSERIRDSLSPLSFTLPTSGWRASVGYQWVSQNWGADLRYSHASDGFGNINDASLLNVGVDGVFEQQRTTQISGWFNHPRTGTYGLIYARQQTRDEQADEVIALNWNYGTQHQYWSAQVQHDQQRGWGTTVSWTYTFGGRSQRSLGVTVAHEEQTDVTAFVQQQPDEINPWGWAIQQQNNPNTTRSGVRYWGSSFASDLDVTRANQQTSWTADVSGTVVLMGGDLWWRRQSPDTILLVDVRYPDIPVSYQNRFYGDSNERGLVMIPDAQGWATGDVSIEPTNIPASIQYDQWVQRVAIPGGTGSVLRFEAREFYSARGQVVDEHDDPLPLGSILTNENGDKIVVGFEGLIYWEFSERIEQWTSEEGCVYHIQYPEQFVGHSNQIHVGTLSCQIPSR